MSVSMGLFVSHIQQFEHSIKLAICLEQSFNEPYKDANDLPSSYKAREFCKHM
jgi:hypothetical protein